MEWQSIYIFISSTFNDMHAERDLLVKRIFPELRSWCAKRHLKLIDVDLRWGVSEKDASENKKVVDICLENIDRCQPFFLSLLGQRRGWIPGFDDINQDTFSRFPLLQDYLGKYSITELEIMHAIFQPMNHQRERDMHALFYFRDGAYLNDIADEDTRALFGGPSLGLDQDLQVFKHTIAEAYPVYTYTGIWDSEQTSPEIANLAGKDFSKGRLCNFTVGDVSFETHVLQHLEAAILAEYPERAAMDSSSGSAISEKDIRDIRLHEALDAYIHRPSAEAMLNDYVTGDRKQPLLLVAASGTGKTSLLSHLIASYDGNCIYRFAGISMESSDAERLIQDIYKELAEGYYISGSHYEQAKKQGLGGFESALMNIKTDRNLLIVIDAIDQFIYAPLPLWIPFRLPANVKLIISMSTNDTQTIKVLESNHYTLDTLHGLESEEEKRLMIDHYLGQFLKTVDEEQISQLLAMKGSSNPLFLKIVLNELRLFGSFEGVNNKLEQNVGNGPISAFTSVLYRLENEKISSNPHIIPFCFLYLEMMALSLDGVSPIEAARIISSTQSNVPEQEARDAFILMEKYLQGYLSIKGEQIDFLYSSLQNAVMRRYKQLQLPAYNSLILLYMSRFSSKGDDPFFEGIPSDLYNLALYLSKTTDKDCISVLCNPWFMWHFCKEYSAFQLAAFIREAVKNRVEISSEMTEEEKSKIIDEAGYPLDSESRTFLELADLLCSISSQVSVNPDSLFSELYNRANKENTLVSSLYQEMNGRTELNYLHLMNPDRSMIFPINSFPLASYRSAFLTSEHVVLLQRETRPPEEVHSFFDKDYTVVRLFRISDLMPERVFELRASHHEACVQGNYLHVTYYGGEGKFSVYKLPEFQEIFYGQLPTLKQDFRWGHNIFVYRGIPYNSCLKNDDDHLFTAIVKLYDKESQSAQVIKQFSHKQKKYDVPLYFLQKKGVLAAISVKIGHISLMNIMNGKEYDAFDIGCELGQYEYTLAEGSRHLFFVYLADKTIHCRIYKAVGLTGYSFVDDCILESDFFYPSHSVVIKNRLLLFEKNKVRIWQLNEDSDALSYVGMQTLSTTLSSSMDIEFKIVEDKLYMLHQNENLYVYNVADFMKPSYDQTDDFTCKEICDMHVEGATKELLRISTKPVDFTLNLSDCSLQLLSESTVPAVRFIGAMYPPFSFMHSIVSSYKENDALYYISNRNDCDDTYQNLYVGRQSKDGHELWMTLPNCRQSAFCFVRCEDTVHLMVADMLTEEEQKVMRIYRLKDREIIYEYAYPNDHLGYSKMESYYYKYWLWYEQITDQETNKKTCLVHVLSTEDWSSYDIPRETIHIFGDIVEDSFVFIDHISSGVYDTEIYDLNERKYTQHFTSEIEIGCNLYKKGNYLIAQQGQQGVLIYDLRTGKKVLRQLLCDTIVRNIPDDCHLLVHTSSGQLKLYEGDFFKR